MNLSLKKQINLNNLILILFFLTVLSLFAFSNITLLSVSIQFIFLSTMVLYSIHQNQIRITIHFGWWIVFIFWGLIITIFSYDILTSSADLINIFLKVLFLTSLILLINNEQKFVFALKAIVIAGVILFLRVVIFTPLHDWGTERLGSAVELNSNTLGLVLAYASICSVFLAKKLNNNYYLFFLIPFIFMGLMTGSRKAIFMILGGISLIILLSLKKKRNIIFVIPFLILFAAVIYTLVMNVPIFYNVLGTRIEGLGILSESTEVDASTQTRTMMINEAWNLFTQRPFLGYGLESFRDISSFGTYSHNNYTELLVSTGVIGTIIYYSLPVGMLISSVFKWKNHNEKDYSFIIVILTMILIMDYGMVSYKHLITQILLALSVSYFFIMKTDKHDISDNKKIEKLNFRPKSF